MQASCNGLRRLASFSLKLIKDLKMILYGSPISPFVRKVLVFAAEKGIELELVPVGIGDPNPAFNACSPFRKMPALSDGDFSISDSTAIVTYLDTKQPAPSLIPSDAQGRARTMWFDEFGDTIAAAAAGKVFFNKIVAPRFLKQEGDAALIAQGEVEFGPVCDYLESVIPASGYLVGDAFSLADISATTSFVNAAHGGMVPDAATYPKLTAYLASIFGRPSFATWIAQERKILG